MPNFIQLKMNRVRFFEFYCVICGLVSKYPNAQVFIIKENFKEVKHGFYR